VFVVPGLACPVLSGLALPCFWIEWHPSPDSSPLPLSSSLYYERVVSLIGKRAERDKALALIQAKVGGRPFGNSNPANTVVRAPLRCVGFLMGTCVRSLNS
jgi:hypothetical protein